MTFDPLKTNSGKFAQYRLKIQKVIELFDFEPLMQHPLYKQRKPESCIFSGLLK